MYSTSLLCYSEDMFPAGVVTFRETLEAALVVGIILSYLAKTKQSSFKRFVWYGVGAGVAISLLLAVGLEVAFGGLPESIEPIVEGVLMFVTAGFLTWMILWVHRQKEIAAQIRQKVALHVEKGYGFGIATLVATAVFREGTETALYLKALALSGGANQLTGAVIGLVIALALGYGIFKWAVKFSLSAIFTGTTFLLMLFAAGLVAHGVHEFQEVSMLPIFSFDPLWNISHILDQGSLFGSFLRAMFGYSSRPTLLEVVSYIGYIGIIIGVERFTSTVISSKFAKK